MVAHLVEEEKAFLHLDHLPFMHSLEDSAHVSLYEHDRTDQLLQSPPPFVATQHASEPLLNLDDFVHHFLYLPDADREAFAFVVVPLAPPLLQHSGRLLIRLRVQALMFHLDQVREGREEKLADFDFGARGGGGLNFFDGFLSPHHLLALFDHLQFLFFKSIQFGLHALALKGRCEEAVVCIVGRCLLQL